MVIISFFISFQNSVAIMNEMFVTVPSQQASENQGPEDEMKNETITLIIPENIASGDGIQVVTLPPGLGDLSNVRVQLADARFDHNVINEPTTCQIVDEVVEPLTGGNADEVNVHGGPQLVVEKDTHVTSRDSKYMKVSIAIQANDYDIERRSGRTPARMRVIPAKFRCVILQIQDIVSMSNFF
jgi:hypothetical protein